MQLPQVFLLCSSVLAPAAWAAQDTPPIPSTAEEWRTFTNSEAVTRLDERVVSNSRIDEFKFIRRGILLELEQVFDELDQHTEQDPLHPASYAEIYSDILVAPAEPSTGISVPAVTVAHTHILASDGDVIHIVLKPQPGLEQFIFYLMVGECDKEVKIWAESPSMSAKWKLEPGFFGNASGAYFALDMKDRKVEHGPLTTLDRPDMMPVEYLRGLQTRLTMSHMLGWTWPSLALEFASAVREATANSTRSVVLHSQANSQETWLRTKELAGPDTHAAPSLTYETYKDTLSSALSVAVDFEEKINSLKFQEVQADVWDDLKQKASDNLEAQSATKAFVQGEFETAKDVLIRSLRTFQAQTIAMAFRREAFKEGIDKYVKEQQRAKIFQFITTLIDIGSAIWVWSLPTDENDSLLALPQAIYDLGTTNWFGSEDPGDLVDFDIDFENPSGVEDPDVAIQNAEAELEALYADGSTEEASDFQESVDAMRAILYTSHSVQRLMDSTLETLDGWSDVDGPGASSIPTRSGDELSEREVEALWDKYIISNAWWIEKCADPQGFNIDYAKEYYEEMKKFATQGKLVASSVTTFLRAAQELAQVRMSYWEGERQVARLSDLNFDTMKDEFEEARSILFERLISMRLDLTVQMDKLLAAKRYRTLEESNVQADPTRELESVQTDLASNLPRELQEWQEKWTKPKDGIEFHRSVTDLAGGQGERFIESMKMNGNGSFFLYPDIAGGTSNGNALRFIQGSEWRIYGIHLFLIGAKPVGSNKPVSVHLSISSSGSYVDNTADGKIWKFVKEPYYASFRYSDCTYFSNPCDPSEMHKYSDIEGGKFPEVYDPDNVWSDPTPFTEWIVRLDNPDEIDLSELEDIVVRPAGFARLGGGFKKGGRHPAQEDVKLD